MLAGVEGARGQAGEVLQWGNNKTSDPTGSDFIQVETGWQHTIALRTDGTVICMANDPAGWGCENAPGPNEHFVYIAAGYYHNIAITTEGRLRLWGRAFFGETTLPPQLPPETRVISVAAGEHISCAIKADATLVVWGNDPPRACGDDPCLPCPHAPNDPSAPQPPFPLVPVPAGQYESVSCSGHFWIARRIDGTLVGKGADYRCQVTDIPLGAVSRFAAGHMHGVALLVTGDRRPVAWGRNQLGQAQLTTICPDDCAITPGACVGPSGDPCYQTSTTCWRPPPSPFPAVKDVEGSYYSTVAKRLDNTLVAWGRNLSSESCPMGGEVANFSCNYFHGGAILIPPGSSDSDANCDGSEQLPAVDAADIICFNSKFAQGDPDANCDSSAGAPLLTANDLLCFIQKVAGAQP